MVVVIRIAFVLQNLAKMRVCSLVLSSNYCRDQFVGRTVGEEFKFLEQRSLVSAAATCRDAGLEMMFD